MMEPNNDDVAAAEDGDADDSGHEFVGNDAAAVIENINADPNANDNNNNDDDNNEDDEPESGATKTTMRRMMLMILSSSILLNEIVSVIKLCPFFSVEKNSLPGLIQKSYSLPNNSWILSVPRCMTW